MQFADLDCRTHRPFRERYGESARLRRGAGGTSEQSNEGTSGDRPSLIALVAGVDLRVSAAVEGQHVVAFGRRTLHTR